MNTRLDRPVDASRDHVARRRRAREITLVEYGSYDCPHCRAANERITEVRDQLGERVRYVFRHRPITGSELARRAAELVEQAATPDEFWSAHVSLMTRSRTLTEEDLVAVAAGPAARRTRAPIVAAVEAARPRARVDADVASSHASGVRFTPTFFINGRRYDGPWDEASFTDAMLGLARPSRAHRRAGFRELGAVDRRDAAARHAARDRPHEHGRGSRRSTRFWETDVGLSFGDAAFRMSLLHWVNDALLTVFFLVVGLEIKREFTVGHLATRRSAALPIAAAIGGMVVPALIYVSLVPAGPWAHGWGVPMATDTAFAVALIAVMGARVPVELRIFLTAAAIVDDIGAIIVVAIFYSDALNLAAVARRAGRGGFPRVAQPLGRVSRDALRPDGRACSGPACMRAACTRRLPACC